MALLRRILCFHNFYIDTIKKTDNEIEQCIELSKKGTIMPNDQRARFDEFIDGKLSRDGKTPEFKECPFDQPTITSIFCSDTARVVGEMVHKPEERKAPGSVQDHNKSYATGLHNNYGGE